MEEEVNKEDLSELISILEEVVSIFGQMREESEEGDKGLKVYNLLTKKKSYSTLTFSPQARIDLEKLRKGGDSKKWLLS